MGSSLIVGLKTRLATSRSTKQDVWRGRCCACLRQWLRHVQGRLRRRRRPQGRLPLHRWTSPPPGCHGRYGTEGCLRRRRGPVQEGYPHPEVPRRARNHHQLGRHGEDLAPHLLQRAPRCRFRKNSKHLNSRKILSLKQTILVLLSKSEPESCLNNFIVMLYISLQISQLQLKTILN